MQLGEVLFIGTSKYRQYEAGDLKCRVVISVNTLSEHRSPFYELKSDRPLAATDLVEVLFCIHRTGRTLLSHCLLDVHLVQL